MTRRTKAIELVQPGDGVVPTDSRFSRFFSMCSGKTEIALVVIAQSPRLTQLSPGMCVATQTRWRSALCADVSVRFSLSPSCS